MEVSSSTAGSGKTNSVADLGTITLNVLDMKVTRKSSGTGPRPVGLGQSSEIAEKKLKGRNVTLQTKYANPALLMIQE